MLECTHYFPINEGYKLGKATIRIPKWKVTIPGFVLMQKDGKRWVNLPSRKVTSKDGEVKYPPNMWFDDKETKDQFLELVKKAIEDHASQTNLEENVKVNENEEIPF